MSRHDIPARGGNGDALHGAGANDYSSTARR